MTTHPSPSSSVADHLRLFHSWTAPQLADLLADTDVITVAPGTVIERVGEYAQQFIGILDGYVEAISEDGVAILGRGDHVGADELFFDVAHRATYRTVTSTTLLVIFGPAFRGVARSLRPAVARSFMATLPSAHAEPALVG